MKGMEDLFKQAQIMQSKMADIQRELANKSVEGSSGGGMVRVVCNGKQELLSVNIDKAAVSMDDLDMLQDLVTAAVNDALRRSRDLAQQDLSSLTGGLNIPGLM